MTTTELALKDQIQPLTLEAASIKITSTQDLETATELLSRLNKTADRIKEEKDKVMRPLLDATAAERERWAPYEKPITASIASLRQEMTRYQTEARKAEQDEKDRIAARVGEGRGHLKPETAMDKIAQVAAPESRIETATGSLKFRATKTFEVVDLKALPAEYLLPNEPAIRKAMKNGVELEGIRYFIEQVPVNSR